MSYYKEQLENFLQTLDIKTDSVFDIGGKENPIYKRTRNWDVKNYTIFDLPDYDLNLDWKNKPKVPEADIIFCLEVFEYLWQPFIALKNIYRLLKKGGIFYCTFPFVYPLHNPKEFDYLRYTKNGIEKLLEEAGFIDWKLTSRIDKSGLLQSFYQESGMHCAKGELHNVVGWIVEAYK